MPSEADLTLVMNGSASREGNLLSLMIGSNAVHPFIIVFCGVIKENRGLIS
jgi:hypothetical protein